MQTAVGRGVAQKIKARFNIKQPAEEVAGGVGCWIPPGSLLHPCCIPAAAGALYPAQVALRYGLFFLAELTKITPLLPLRRVLLLLLFSSLISVLSASLIRDKLSAHR